MQGQSSSPTTADDLSPSSSLSEMRLCESNSESSASPSQLSDTQSISEAIEDVSPSGADDGLRTLPSLKATVPSVDAYAFPPQTKGEGCVERSHSHSGVGDESVGGISDTGLYLATPTASGLDALASCPDQAKIPQTTDEPEFPITPDKTDMGTPPENMRASSTPLRDVTVGDYMITELPLIAPTSTATTDSIPASSAILSSTATSQERILPNQSLQQFSDETPGVCSTDTTNGASNGRSTASTLLVTDNGQEVSGGDARADTQLDLDSSEEISTPSASSDEEMSGYELKILGIPTNGIRTRVETQINLCLELVATDGRPLFEKLHIDQRLVSKTSQMVGCYFAMAVVFQ
ncbi:hypothetical protein SARC_04010 [Sphaeroforma arctica JP610]|uniref:Uncharacterized protein n=1 Tax=Sphaeroforma arctica JP610 TaxID=667725 RepID=A0A0L0G3Y5_9EUKA|nr:hypothetical protein SARC_04010 [Sphaeroforma arctica JP610]KNC83760.1 hypothetical protein SARC_04010 [Sphaeroforma arctica JP610]|eukprot:XP_014157662.1 hypothetical protein SARC_04010 [Sphaeroforma arctica JP610]